MKILLYLQSRNSSLNTSKLVWIAGLLSGINVNAEFSTMRNPMYS